MKSSAEDLRSAIDEITLQVAEKNATENDLPAQIADQAMAHISRLHDEQRSLTDQDIDRVASAIVRGVLQRLYQIAAGGGQIGSA